MPAMEEFGKRIARYLAHRMPEACDVEVQEIQRIHGGASRETYRLRASYTADGAEQVRGLILRRDPPGSLIDTDRANEFNAYLAFHKSEVPVPEPLWLEEDPAWLDRPFFVMEEISGCEARSTSSRSASRSGAFSAPSRAAIRRRSASRSRWSTSLPTSPGSGSSTTGRA
jgi:aminoglycoside phosphotransferase (APT) family kinase protein